MCDRIDKTAAPPVEWREQLALLVVQGLTVRREIEQAIEAKHLEIKGLDAGKIMVEADEDLIHQVIHLSVFLKNNFI